MDVFAIEKGKALKLSVDEFEKQTFPLYRECRSAEIHAMSILTTEQKRIKDFLCMRFAQNAEILYRL